MQDRFVYADNAATTPVDQAVVEKMLPFFTKDYGNASTLYKLGQSSHDALEEARRQIALTLNCDPKEVCFTAGGTESDNMALRGMMHTLRAKGKTHMITTTMEHHAILHTAADLEKEGYSVTYLPVDKTGLVDLNKLDEAIGEETGLVSIMAANNEIGTVQDLAAIGALCKRRGVFFHTDAVQAFGHVPLDVQAMGIDLLSLSGHKINAPKGIGALYIRSGLQLKTLITGGGQEKNRRSGTENIPGIVGLGEAARLRRENMEAEMAHLRRLSEKLQQGVLERIPQSMLTGHPTQRLPGTSSFVFPAIEGESLVLMLDMNGICASTGSACSTGSLDPSHVLMAIGMSKEIAHGSLRLTLGHQNTEEDVDYILDRLPGIVAKLRAMSPVWNG